MKRKYSPRFVDKHGQIFGRLTVLELDKIQNNCARWFCECICGNVISVLGYNLTRGNTQSCGCLTIDVQRKRNTKHGMFKTRFYNIWAQIKLRCLNKNNPSYATYGGSGITVCARWLKFENFRDDMYESYLEHVKEFGEKNTSIDRFPNQTGNYEPGNVRWATAKEQIENTCIYPDTKNYKKHNFWKIRLFSILNAAISNNSKKSLITKYLGCSLLDFRKYIESQFIKGMTWDNHGNVPGTWQFDHIKGCNNFDLSKEEDRLICFNYKNLRPMWYETHKNKSVRRIK
jgi:hypothetical protein